jgi:hypothetical protein
MSTEQIQKNPSTGKKILRASKLFYVISFGIVLPLVALAIEVLFAWCAQVFFDPVPTLFHGVMVALVPLANLFALLASWGRFQSSRRRILFLNGIAIGISAFYSVLFIPIMPMAVIAMIWLIGLLPLAPILSLIAAIICRRAIPQPTITDPIPSLPLQSRRFNAANWGIVVGLIVLIAAEVPLTLTEIGLRMATSDNHQEQLRGVRLLRNFANQDRLLSYCYDQRNRSRDMLSMLYSWNEQWVSSNQAREVYYRVTGQAFNEQEYRNNRRRGLRGNSRRLNFDFDQGGSVVGARLQHVQLSSSQIDGSIDSDAALAYLQWTFEFSNQSPRQAEARAQIALPPGAVVSRVTLWIDGEEREAAFAAKGQARQAYQSVVRRQRDPILVTTSGPDTVLVQLFPVPVSGKIKARIGITAPLVIRDASEGILRLPYFKQQNFNIADDFQHSLWLDSKATMRSEPAHLILESGNSGAATLRGKLDDAGLKSPSNAVLVSRDSRVMEVHTLNNRGKAGSVVTQRLIKRNVNIDHLVMVVDGSQSMQDYSDQIADAILKLPESFGLTLIVAGDETIELSAGIDAENFSLPRQLAQRLRDFDFVGGVDNTAALERAWSVASGHQNSAVLWIHAAQPVMLSTADNLRQNWQRRPMGPELYDFPVANRVNRIAEALDEVVQFKAVARIANLQQDLSYQFALWSGQRQQWNVLRDEIAGNDMKLPGQKTSDHLLRLWAYDRIQALIAAGTGEQRKRAVQMAARYQLVTPVSGAVVLENQQQYEANGLQPVEEGTVPTIPEPETWLLIIATLLMLGWVLKRRHMLINAGRFCA